MKVMRTTAAQSQKKHRPALSLAAKLFLTSLISLGYLFSAGCVNHLELGDLLIIQALGLDYEDGVYKVSAQYYTGQSGESGGGSPTMYTVNGEGAGIIHAMQEAGFNSGRPLLMGECQVFVIGESVMDKSLFSILGVFTTEYKSYPKVIICAAAGKASDVLAVKYKDESVTLHRLHRMLKNSQETGISPNSFLSTIMKNSLNGLGSACLPLVEVADDRSDSTEDGKTVRIAGAALFTDDYMKAYIGPAEMSGIAWLKNDVKEAAVTVVVDGKPVAVNLFEMRTDLMPEQNGEKLVVKVKCSAQIGYIETHISGTEDEKNEKILKLTERAVTERLMNTLKTVVSDNGADMINLEETLRHKDYRLWTKIEDDWAEIMKNIRFEVSSEINISRYSRV